MKRIFVYGSLKRGGFLNDQLLLSGARFEKEAELEGYSLWSVGGMFPAMLPAAGKVVVGEVWRIDSDFVKNWLDQVEAAYERIPVTLTDGTEAEAYRWNRPDEWLTHHGENWNARRRHFW